MFGDVDVPDIEYHKCLNCGERIIHCLEAIKVHEYIKKHVDKGSIL